MNRTTNGLAALLNALRRSLALGRTPRLSSSPPSPTVGGGPNGIGDHAGEGPAHLPTASVSGTAERDVGAFGVMVNHLLYDATALAEVHRAAPLDRKIKIASDPDDLGHVHAILPDGRTIILRAVDYAYACGLTLQAHLAMLRDPRSRAARLGPSDWAGEVRPASRPVPRGECAELNALLERRARR